MRIRSLLVALVVLCAGAQALAQTTWHVSDKPLAVVHGMRLPESGCVDPQTGMIYVSNIYGEPWADDHEGFITQLKPDGSLSRWRWRTATAQGPMSAPKGMVILNGWLYVADINRVHAFSLTGSGSGTLTIPGAGKLNDAATDGQYIFVSDTLQGKIVRIAPDLGSFKIIDAVASINGLTFHNGELYGVSWDLHDIFWLDKTGRYCAHALGLSSYFTNLDGIEALPDGSFVVSDFWGNKVCLVEPDQRTVRTLVEISTPADIGVDLQRGKLLIPQFWGKQLTVYGFGK
jgi:hypothetical protein